MSMQGLATTGQFEAGLALLARAETSGLLADSHESGYNMFHILLQTCRSVGNSHVASQVEAARERLGVIALAAMATALVQGSVRHYVNGGGGEGIADTQQLWLELCQLMGYKPQLQALPWGFGQSSTQE